MLFLARIVDGLSGGNISTARAYVADVTEPKDRARAYGLIGAAFGLGFIFGPALSGVLAQVSYTAPIWAAAALTLVATAMAWFWLPETVHRAQAGTGMPFRNLPEMLRRPGLRRVLVDRLRLLVRVRDFPDDVRAVRGAALRVRRAADRLFLRGFGVLGAVVQGGFIRPIVRRLGDKPTFIVGLVCRRDRSRGGRRSRTRCRCSRWRSCRSRSASASATRRCRAWSAAPARGDEQGRVQGAASAVESLGRTLGPVWGTASLQRFGEATPYLSAAAFFLLTLVLSLGYRVTEVATDGLISGHRGGSVRPSRENRARRGTESRGERHSAVCRSPPNSAVTSPLTTPTESACAGRGGYATWLRISRRRRAQPGDRRRSRAERSSPRLFDPVISASAV